MRLGNELIGVIVYSTTYKSLAGRNIVFGDYYKNNIKRVNRDIARIARVIIHPKFRGVGLGVKLVKETMPLVGKKIIEAIAVMAKYNPFFEKAGMKRIDIVRKLTKEQKKALEFLKSKGFDIELIRSKKYCEEFLNSLTNEERKKLESMLKHFPEMLRFFLKKKIPNLSEMLSRLLPMSTSYFYYIVKM
jgi:GNAT superfamily N-acetyltransferase